LILGLKDPGLWPKDTGDQGRRRLERVAKVRIFAEGTQASLRLCSGQVSVGVSRSGLVDEWQMR